MTIKKDVTLKGALAVNSTAAGTTSSAGTAETSVTVSDSKIGRVHYTSLLTTADIVIGTAGDNADLAFGKKLYTFPAAAGYLVSASFTGALQAESSQQTADTPEIGLGSVVASGAVAVLGGTATFESYIEGTAVADSNGTSKSLNSAAKHGAAIAASQQLFLNVSATWANDTDGANMNVTLKSGAQITIQWTEY